MTLSLPHAARTGLARLVFVWGARISLIFGLLTIVNFAHGQFHARSLCGRARARDERATYGFPYSPALVVGAVGYAVERSSCARSTACTLPLLLTYGWADHTRRRAYRRGRRFPFPRRD